MLKFLHAVFFYPFSPQWGKDYDNGRNTTCRSVLSGIALGLLIAFLYLTTYVLTQT